MNFTAEQFKRSANEMRALRADPEGARRFAQANASQILRYMESKYGKRCPTGVFLLDYFISQDLLKTAEFCGRLSGVIIFRKVRLSRFDPKELMKNDPRGDCAFVCELCADDTEAMADLERQMRLRLGKCRHIGMHRHGVAKFYDYDKYINKLLGKRRKEGV